MQMNVQMEEANRQGYAGKGMSSQAPSEFASLPKSPSSPSLLQPVSLTSILC